jgi:hypothetical protein
MRSGEADIDRNQEYYRSLYEEILDKQFLQNIFRPIPALVSKKRINGPRMWKPYQGGEYDPDAYELVQNMWDHEHCSICNFTILTDHTYWLNDNGVRLLCDECHDYFSA